MSFTNALPTLLLVALALVMLGLGLSLSIDDFKRLRHHPKAVVVALVLQMVLLPAACWALIVGFSLSPVFAVGLMLLAASPGGVSANLFSHLFRGDVALNISLTGITTVLSVVTLPLFANLAIAAFAGGEGGVVPLQFRKVAEVVGVVLLPVVLGMAIARRRPALAARAEKPFKLLSALVLAAFALIALAKEWDALVASAAGIGAAVVSFNLLSLLSGYFVSRWIGLPPPMATAISYEIGIHNSTLAIYIALSVLGNLQMALPAAAYSVSMYVVAALFGVTVLRRQRASPAPATT